jgi:hypothetical protein
LAASAADQSGATTEMSIYRGWADEISEQLIRGWCDPPGHPSIYVNGSLIGLAELAGPREDASRTAYGFLFWPSRFLSPGLNRIRILLPDGTIPGNGEVIVDYDPDRSAAEGDGG